MSKFAQMKDVMQDRIVKQMIKTHNSTNSLVLLEAPTGFGKSYVLVKLAKALIEQNPAKKVIISTHTNKLALDLEATAKKLISDRNIGIVLGKNNYIDIAKLKEQKEKVEQYCRGVDEYIKKLETSPSKENWLVETFINETLLDLDMEKVVKNLISADERIKEAGRFDEFDISITNHFFLLSNFFFVGRQKNRRDADESSEFESEGETVLSFNPDDYEILLDEVHTLSQTADSLFASSFSPYRLSYLIGEFVATAKDILPKKTIKAFQGLEKKMRNITLVHSRKDLVGEYFKSTDSKYMLFLSDLVDVASKYNTTELVKKIREVISQKPSKMIYNLQHELREMNTILSSNHGTGFIKYSPTRGYPSIMFQRTDGGYALTNLFWNRKKKMFGTSATIKPFKAKRSAGIENVLGYKGNMNYTLLEIPYLWGKKQKTFIVDENSEVPSPPNIGSAGEMDDELMKEMQLWGSYVARVVAATYHNKKSIILTGSYLQVKTISDEIVKLLGETQILSTTPDRTMSSVINRFVNDRSIKIMIAARHYGVGIDLPGESLEKLYIARLPFPVLNFKWLQRKHRYGSDYIDETIINFRQWMGRLLRSENDTGSLYVLDERIHRKEIWQRIEGFIVERSKEIVFFEPKDFMEVRS